MEHITPFWKKITFGGVFAVIAAVGVNAAIGLAMLHSPDGVLMQARYGGPAPRMVADLGALPAVEVCGAPPAGLEASEPALRSIESNAAPQLEVISET